MRKMPQVIREYMPYGRVLVVDDVETNLYVARGLLAPYGLSVETAVSGFETIERIRDGAVYDIIFMDHFMPKMDGIETVQKIRGMGYTQPIIALTANALTGQAEMFQENGFDGFISKPIDLRQLNASLNMLVRDRHPNEEVEAARRMKDGLEKIYAPGGMSQQVVTELADIFIRDAEKTIVEMGKMHKKWDDLKDGDMQNFIDTVHAMKNTLADIGETELSEFAFRLEQAGLERNVAIISDETKTFLDKLQMIVRKIKPKWGHESGNTEDADHAFLDENLRAIRTACAADDRKTAKAALIALKKKTWPRPVKEQLNIITEYLMNGDFEAVIAAVKKLENP
jgi:CheY-like chemotaxis protein/HPt (histidine-containing phosphotransfer) domain-containing protein